MSGAIFLIGPMASGKSAVGAQLARLLDTDALDTDALVVQQHGPIPEIFARLGESAFRGFETEALAQIARARIAPPQTAAGQNPPGQTSVEHALRDRAPAQDSRPVIVATGGGAVLAAENRRLLSQGFTVYLFTDARTVEHRIATDTTRPLLAGNGPECASRAGAALESWSRIFAERAALYEQCADVRIDTRTLGPEQIAEAIITAYRDARH